MILRVADDSSAQRSSLDDRVALSPARMDVTAFVGEHPTGPELVPITVHRWQDFATSYNAAKSWLADAIRGFFANGGATAIVCNVGASKTPHDRLTRYGHALRLLEPLRDIALVCAPGRTEPAIHEAVLLDCEALRTRLAVLDGPAEVTPNELARVTRTVDSASGVCVFPWIYVRDAEWGRRLVPPSGHTAGLLARAERERGVHQSPAGDVVRGAVGTPSPIGHAQAAQFASEGMNCIRDFGERGLRLVGASTLDGGSVATRRLAQMIERTVEVYAEHEPDPERVRRTAQDLLASLRAGGIRDESLSGIVLPAY